MKHTIGLIFLLAIITAFVFPYFKSLYFKRKSKPNPPRIPDFYCECLSWDRVSKFCKETECRMQGNSRCLLHYKKEIV